MTDKEIMDEARGKIASTMMMYLPSPGVLPSNSLTLGTATALEIAAQILLQQGDEWEIGVHRKNGELPKSERYTFPIAIVNAYEAGQQDMLNEGWVKKVRQVVE